jgi:hypothetical protein
MRYRCRSAKAEQGETDSQASESLWGMKNEEQLKVLVGNMLEALARDCSDEYIHSVLARYRPSREATHSHTQQQHQPAHDNSVRICGETDVGWGSLAP